LHIGRAKPFYASSPHWERQSKSGRTPTIVDNPPRREGVSKTNTANQD
jgi:hypothetical protein